MLYACLYVYNYVVLRFFLKKTNLLEITVFLSEHVYIAITRTDDCVTFCLSLFSLGPDLQNNLRFIIQLS